MKELNVIGTMQLLAAAQKVPRLRKRRGQVDHGRVRQPLRGPALFREDADIGGSHAHGYAKDASRSRATPGGSDAAARTRR
jgi:UDP-glucose 4-epimerase